MQVNITINKHETHGYILSVQTKYKLKIWPWAYTDLATAEFVKTKIDERWDECPVQKYEDYALVFTENLQDVTPTSISINEMSEPWINTDRIKVDLKRVSGYNEPRKS